MKRQREFMENGVSHLKPLTMVQVAEVVGVHETTVSRAVSGKYGDAAGGVRDEVFLHGRFADGHWRERVQHQRQGHDFGHLQSRGYRQAFVRPGSGEDAQGKGIVIARRTVAKCGWNSTSCLRTSESLLTGLEWGGILFIVSGLLSKQIVAASGENTALISLTPSCRHARDDGAGVHVCARAGNVLKEVLGLMVSGQASFGVVLEAVWFAGAASGGLCPCQWGC